MTDIYDSEIAIREAIKQQIRLGRVIGSVGETSDYTEVAIEALEKRIPMKPIVNNYYEETKTYEYICPVCKNNSWYSLQEHQKYCSECGQRIDWEGAK